MRGRMLPVPGLVGAQRYALSGWHADCIRGRAGAPPCAGTQRKDLLEGAMSVVAGLFGDRDAALKALEELRGAGVQEGMVAVIASPSSAGRVAQEAARELSR